MGEGIKKRDEKYTVVTYLFRGLDVRKVYKGYKKESNNKIRLNWWFISEASEKYIA
jgi:hypothetical protein